MHCQITEYLARLTSKQCCTCGHAVRCRHSLMKSVVTTVGPSSSASPSWFSACLPSSKPLIASDNTCRKSWLYRHPADAVLLQVLHDVSAVLRVTLQVLCSMHGHIKSMICTPHSDDMPEYRQLLTQNTRCCSTARAIAARKAHLVPQRSWQLVSLLCEHFQERSCLLLQERLIQHV